MFLNQDLQDHLETSSMIRTDSLILAEWNLNIAENIRQTGNYRFRPLDTVDKTYNFLPSSFVVEDGTANTTSFYWNATDANTVIFGGFTNKKDNNGQPILDGLGGLEATPVMFSSPKEKEKMLFSLDDCLHRFRPRSGINKLRYFANSKYTHNANADMSRRPRYYIADRLDAFKYWTSYRHEDGIERGISNKAANGGYYIDDSVPYVVYNEAVPVNRLIVKMQTNVGDIDFGTFQNSKGSFADPFFGTVNQTTPVKWKIQYLSDTNWIDAISFNSSSARKDGTSIIGTDGYVEVSYGLIIPDDIKQSLTNLGASLVFAGTYALEALLPPFASVDTGSAYLVKANDNDPGTYYVSIGTSYYKFPAKYDWYLQEEDINTLTSVVTDVTSPAQFTNSLTGQLEYRELKYISGIRIVVETMNKFDSSFDLIEFSPRLIVDLSGKVKAVSVKKSASDLGVSGMPVGQLLASTGTLDIFDYDQAFFPENTNSIISSYTAQHFQVKVYEIVSQVNGYNYYIPVKTLYSEGFPSISSSDRTVSLTLRDMFFYFESITAPQLLLENVSLSSAISILLDYCGFSNYAFKRVADENEMIIPYFSVAPDTTVAQVLSMLAVSSQSAMFFDEYNNFIVLSKNYIMPTIDERSTDVTLYGSEDFTKSGITKNSSTKIKLANIMDLASKTNTIYNDGVINYRSAYIQRSYASIKQASLIDRDKTWIYKPSLLWEVSAPVNTKATNETVSSQSGYALSAIPLNSDITDVVPSVEENKIINNVIDLGDGIYNVARNNGYFYANGEVIRYDALQYSVPGLSATDYLSANVDGDTVWITSTQDYERYFAKMPFNGKIYPTGLMRIYTEPNYEVVEGITRLKNGAVAKHGRGQFGTKITNHSAGLSSEWSSADNLRGCTMESKYLFSSNANFNLAGVFSNGAVRDVATFSAPEVQISATITIDTAAVNSILYINSVSHGLNSGDLIYFSTTGSLPSELSTLNIYFVRTIINTDKFSVSLINSAEIQSTTSTLTQSGVHAWTLTSATAQSGSASLTTFTSNSHGLSVGDIIYLNSSGSLPTGMARYKKYTVLDSATNTFTLTSNFSDPTPIAISVPTGPFSIVFVKIAYPVVIASQNHRVIPGDIVTFTTTGTLPGLAGNNFYVTQTAFSDYSFMISSTSATDRKFSYVPTSTGIHTLSLYTTENISKTQIVVPDTSNLAIGQTVELYSGLGSLKNGTKITAIDLNHKTITISPQADVSLFKDYIDPLTGNVITNVIHIIDKPDITNGKAGIDIDKRSSATTRIGTIKNFLSNTFLEDGVVKPFLSTQTGTVQSSALVMTGGDPIATDPTPSFISYVYKPLQDRFVHFGTRMRIVGKLQNTEFRGQSPYGSTTYYTSTTNSTTLPVVVGGASGGISILLNPETNSGYFFEIAALTQNNLQQYTNSSVMHNMLFYKIQRNANGTSDSSKAIPVKLWGGMGNIIVDDGLYTGQYRMASEVNPTVYDLAVEYQEIGTSLRFFLYVNNILVATVTDDDPPMISSISKISNASITGSIATLQTFSDHQISPGSIINISISNPSNGYKFNGRRMVDSVTHNTITYTVPTSSISVYSSSMTTGVATIVTDTVHGINAGAHIDVTGLTGYNTTNVVVTKVTSNTITYTLGSSTIPDTLDLGSGAITLTVGSGTTTLSSTDVNNPVGITNFFSDISVHNNMALFVRGSSKVMFENVYALGNNYSQNTVFSLGTVSDSIFSNNEINVSNSFEKYALSGIVQSTFLSGIGSLEPPKYNIYFEEFGTILREAAHFDIRYDKAFPALYAQIAPTFNKLKGYTISGFIAGSYGAEFLVFNATDTTLNLDATSGNYLRILGITFTQTSQNQLTVDEYFAKKSDLSNPEFITDTLVDSKVKIAKNYSDIKFSRMTYGKKQFSMDATYIQNRDDADNLMSWIMSKLMKPRKSVGIKVFGMPTIQLGDIVAIDYTNKEGVDEISSLTDRFVVYSIDYSKKEDGPSMTIYLSGIS